MAVHCVFTPGKDSIEHRVDGADLYLCEEVMHFSSITESWPQVALCATVLVLGAESLPDTSIEAEVCGDDQLVADADGWYGLRSGRSCRASSRVATVSKTPAGATVYHVDPRADGHHVKSLYRVLNALHASVVDGNVCYVPYRDSVITKLLWRSLVRSPADLTLLFRVSLCGSPDETAILRVAQLCHALQAAVNTDPAGTSRALWAIASPQKGRIATAATLAQIEKERDAVLGELLARYEAEAAKTRLLNQQKLDRWQRHAAQHARERKAQLAAKDEKLDREIEILTRKIEVVRSAALPRNDKYAEWEAAETARVQALIETRSVEMQLFETRIGGLRANA